MPDVLAPEDVEAGLAPRFIANGGGDLLDTSQSTNKTAPVVPAYPITSPTAITCGAGGQLTAGDAYTFDVNGEQTQDLSALMSADSSSIYLSHTWDDAYNQVGQLTQVSDGSTQTEAYQHDPVGDLISQTVAGSTTTYSYSRGLLQSSATSGQTSTYNYDPLGQLDTVTGPDGSIQQSERWPSPLAHGLSSWQRSGKSGPSPETPELSGHLVPGIRRR